MPRVDAIDISHHNTLTAAGFDSLPDTVRMCITKVNEGRALDREQAKRLPVMAATFELWGGYTVLLPEAPGRSTIRQQVETYVSQVEAHWRPGALTQLDIEVWAGRYERPVSVAEILEAADHHERLLGRRPIVYINPREMPAQFAEWHRIPGRDPLWEPYYDAVAPWTHGHPSTRQAAIWQWTSTWKTPAFTGGIDANEVLDWPSVLACAGVSIEPTEPDLPAPPPGEWPTSFVPDTGVLFDSTCSTGRDYVLDLGWARSFAFVRFEIVTPTTAGHITANGYNAQAVVNYTSTGGSELACLACPDGKATFRLGGPSSHTARVRVTLQGRA